MKRSRRYKSIAENFDREALLSPRKAIKLIKETSNSKFDESVEVHFRLGIDPRQADQQLRGTLALPNGTGKSLRVLAICSDAQIEEAKAAGADYAGSDELIEKIQSGWFEFDLVLATPDMMGKVGKLGRQLGSKGVMPNPKSGTVTPNLASAIKEFKGGKVEYRNDKAGIIHLIVGKISFTEDQLVENFAAVYDTINKVKPSKAKGVYLRSISCSSSMGPGVFVEPQKIRWEG